MHLKGECQVGTQAAPFSRQLHHSVFLRGLGVLFLSSSASSSVTLRVEPSGAATQGSWSGFLPSGLISTVAFPMPAWASYFRRRPRLSDLPTRPRPKSSLSLNSWMAATSDFSAICSRRASTGSNPVSGRLAASSAVRYSNLGYVAMWGYALSPDPSPYWAPSSLSMASLMASDSLRVNFPSSMALVSISFSAMIAITRCGRMRYFLARWSMLNSSGLSVCRLYIAHLALLLRRALTSLLGIAPPVKSHSQTSQPSKSSVPCSSPSQIRFQVV
mmetsp:Transcript_18729/g.48019  ORF Transcript_18729/g.48019 Transcript_18729/m.48019 type:complete len:273 (+) Transcript_18729:1853-2671(+)